jgi:hypothetical protein
MGQEGNYSRWRWVGPYREYRVDEWADVHEYSIDGWTEVFGYYADGCIKVDVYEIDR